MSTEQIAAIGSNIITRIEHFGMFSRFVASTIRWLFAGTGNWKRNLRLLLPQLYNVGTLSIPVVMIVGGFVGMVLAIEGFDQFASIGQEARLGGVINVSVVKQIGPVLAAVMIAGRVGGAVAAELGTMTVTEQIDAMRVMGADPIAYLVVPRVVACVIMVPILTVFSDLTGIFGGYFITVNICGVNAQAYWDFSAQFVAGFEVATGLIKATVFGLMIGLISCFKGFNCGSGAAGVGQAVTESFVTSFLVIIMANLFIAKFLNDFFSWIFPYGSMNAFG